jgi:phi13 family phage major tail protein
MSVATVRELKYGARMPIVAPILSEPEGALPTYGAGMRLSKLVKSTESFTYKTGDFYADDENVASKEIFDKGDVTIDHTGMTDDVMVAVMGVTKDADGAIRYNGDDDPPNVGYGFIAALDDNNISYYMVVWYPKCKPTMTSDSFETAGSSIKYSGKQSKFKVFRANTGDYKITKKFDNLAAAQAWIETKLNVATWYYVNVSVSGTGTVSPVGHRAYPAGEDVEITIGGSPAKVYDDGADVTSSVTGGKYTITNLAANHNIAVIYTA